MQHKTKAQFAADFIIVLILIMALLLFVFSIIKKENARYSLDEARFNAEKVLNDLTAAINNVFLSGDNANTTLYLPSTLPSSVNYTLAIYPNAHIAELKYRSKHLASKILTANINPGIVPKGQITIKNENGFIQLS